MLLVTREDEGVYTLNYAWLPAWIGLNVSLLGRIESELKTRQKGKPVTPESLHDEVVQVLLETFPNIRGLAPVLESIRGVAIDEDESTASAG